MCDAGSIVAKGNQAESHINFNKYGRNRNFSSINIGARGIG
jgi:hypothetical protein